MMGFRRIDIMAPSHPLARASRTPPAQARNLVQPGLSERPAAENRDFGVVSLNTWCIGDPAARHRLNLAQIGWGGMPDPIVRREGL